MYRRRALRRDIAQAVFGLALIALLFGFTQTRPFYFLVKSALDDRLTKANINGSTDLYLIDHQLTDTESGKPVATVRWKASRQAIGKPPLLLWEGGSIDITTITIHDPAVTEPQVHDCLKARGVGPAFPGFVGARDLTLDGKPTRRLFPTPFTQVHHVNQALTTFRSTWPRAAQLSLIALIILAVVSISFPRTCISWNRARRGRCLNCGYNLGQLQSCPECNAAPVRP